MSEHDEEFDDSATSRALRTPSAALRRNPDPERPVTVNTSLPVELDGDDWRYALVPIVHHEVVDDWVLRDGVFPAIQRAALGDGGDPN